jgi:putative membrane protein
MRSVQWSMALVLLIGSGAIYPALSGDKKEQAGEKLSDAMFVMKASEGNMAEIALSKLAMKQAQNDKVREFAQHMIDDHTKANEQLKEIANKHQLKMAQELSKQHKDLHQKLSNIKGREFDGEFMASQVKAHREAANMYESHIKNSQLPEIRAYAQKTLPIVEMHLKKAQEIAAKVDGKQ